MSPASLLRQGFVIALLSTSIAPYSLAGDKKKDSPCGKPPDVVSASQPTKEELEKARKLKAQGAVSISISEDGDVVEAKVVGASSQEAANLLLARAKSMKFKARPGCGIFKTSVNFSLAGG